MCNHCRSCGLWVWLMVLGLGLVGCRGERPSAPAAPRAVEVADVRLPMNPQGGLDANIERLAAEPYDAGTLAAAGGPVQGRIRVRQLMSFETDGEGKPLEGFEMDGKPIPQLSADAENFDCVYVQDKGVTDGRWCARLTAKAGADWATTVIRGDVVKNWADYDYAALDVYSENGVVIHFELWDQNSTNYPTRCTIVQAARPGKQTLLFPISRAKRNNKEGRSWEELEPKDKIDLENLKFVKIFVQPPKDRPLQFWVDNLRLMQEDAAKPKMTVLLPRTALAYDFCSIGAVVPGFSPVTASSVYSDEQGYGFVEGKNLAEGGTGWPDLLSGTYVMAGVQKEGQTPGVPMIFKARVPNGKYLLWLAGGEILRSEAGGTDFTLKVNDKVLYQDKPDRPTYDSEKYLHRFLWTQYSERPHAVWLDYVDRMVPTWTTVMDIADGTLTISACNHFLSAVVLVPAAAEADFRRMTAKIQVTRMKAFEETMQPVTPKRPAPPASGEDYVIYVPQLEERVGVASAPRDWGTPDYKREVPRLADVAAPGQNVFWRLAIVPFADTLREGRLVLSDLTGPGGAIIPASAIQGHLVNYRVNPRGVGESILLPTLSFRVEKGITLSLWLWLSVPADARPGQYAGRFTFQPAAGKTTDIPVTLDVLPVKLERDLPVSFGMYYGGRPDPRPADYWDVIRQQVLWMKKIGFTATSLMDRSEIVSIQDDTVEMKFDSTGPRMLKEAGFGRLREQMQMTSQLGLARAIGRRLGARVDQDPGSEFQNPRFLACYASAIAQYRNFLDSLGVAYACEMVDEPRAVPNPWNRNLADTCRYGDLMRDAGFKTRFVTPMGDTGGDGDYTTLVDHADILSIHAGRGSAKIQEKTLATTGKTLWFYNSGMSRYMWGACPWAVGVKGRWEWHWCWSGEGGGGFPSEEWYCPFAGSSGTAQNADPRKYPGGFLYTSSLLTAAEGITDYAYFYTLERAVDAAKDNPAKAAAAQKARDFLAKVKAGVPSPASAQPGRERPTPQMLTDWRLEAGRLIVQLQ